MAKMGLQELDLPSCLKQPKRKKGKYVGKIKSLKDAINTKLQWKIQKPPGQSPFYFPSF